MASQSPEVVLLDRINQTTKENAKNVSSVFDVVTQFKNNADKNMKDLNNGLSHLGNNLAKSFSLNSLGSKIGDTLNRGFKTITSPFANLGNKISNTFSSGLKILTNPFKSLGDKIGGAFQGLKDKFKKPVTAVKSLFGKTDEQRKNRFYTIWSSPKAVARIWAKEFEKNKAKSFVPTAAANGAGGSLAGIMQGVSKVLSVIADSVKKVASAISFFFAGPGAGIAIAIGVMPLVALIGFVFFKLFSKIEPLIDSVLSTSKLVNTIADKICAFIDDPTAFITKLAASFVNGMFNILDTFVNRIKETFGRPLSMIKNGVGAAFNGVKNFISSKFGNKEEEQQKEKPDNSLSNSLNTLNASVIDLKSLLINGSAFTPLSSKIDGVQNLLKSGELDNSFIRKLSNMKLVKKLEGTNDKIYQIISDISDAFIAFKDKVVKFVTGFKLSDGLKSAFNGVKNTIKSWFSGGQNPIEVKAETVVKTEGNTAFDEIIKSFEKMHNDTIQLMTDIKNSILNIEKSKISIGNTFATNTAEASDSKKMNNLQNITLNYQVDIKQVLDKMDSTNEILNDIVKNTSINEKGETKPNAVWRI